MKKLLTLTLIALLVLPAWASAALTDSLASYWKLDESSGNAVDAHASNDLTNNNTVAYVAAKINNGADFESGSSESLTISDASQSGLDITGDLSFSMWFKPESQPATDSFLVLASKYNSSSGNVSYGFAYGDTGGTPNLRFIASSDGSTVGAATVNQTLSNGTTYHLVAVYDASAGSVEFFVNGSSIGTATGTLPTSIFSGAAEFALGTLTGGGGGRVLFIDGVEDEVGIWSRTLTSTEVTSLYNGGSGLSYDDFVAEAPAVNYQPIIWFD